MRRTVICLLLAALLVAAAGTLYATGQGEAGGKTAAPIKLGGVWPLSDVTGDQGSKAALLAVKEINAAGGVLGRQLQLVVVDDEMKAEKGASALEKLATVDNVDIFLGGMASGVHLGQIPVLKKYQKLTLWTGAAASATCEKAIGTDADWYFHLHPWDYQQGASYADGWKAIQAKYPNVKLGNWFLAYEEGPFGAGSFTSSKTLYASLGAVGGESFKSAAQGGGDYSALLQHAKAANPDVFIWAGYDADALPLLEQSKAIGFAPPLFIGAPPGWPVDFGKSPMANGVVLYGMWAPSMSNASPSSKHFYDAYVKEYGKEPATYFAPLSYSAVYILKDAIKRAGTMDQAALIKAMEQTKYDSAVGESVTFTPSNIIKHQGINRQKILQWQNGVQQVIWPFEVKTADLMYPFPGWGGK
jgi:branched-chain amino acid transport system substrate-binding protein